jgi:hypothetical protein
MRRACQVSLGDWLTETSGDVKILESLSTWLRSWELLSPSISRDRRPRPDCLALGSQVDAGNNDAAQ